MFQSSRRRMRALLDVVDEMLADASEPVLPHPHRRPVRLALERRAGSVSPRSMPCVSPVRPPVQRGADRVH